MPGTSDVIYLYDGSFEGLLCCVHESVYTHELPVDIQPEEAAQPTLFRQKYIAADEEKAARVYDSIPRKISPDAAALVQCVFLSCMPGKELAILRFLLLGYRRGRQTMYLLSHTAVQPMLAARQNLLNEAHLLKEFLRFSDYDGALAATITPKNYVLPFLKEHFCSRLKNETFLIFDRTHKAALVWQDRKARIISLDTLELLAFVGDFTGRAVVLHDVERVACLRSTVQAEHLYRRRRASFGHFLAVFVEHRFHAARVHARKHYVAYVQRTVLYEHRSHVTAPLVECRFDDGSRSAAVRIGFQVEHFGFEQHFLEQFVEVQALFGRNLLILVFTAP